MTDKPAVDEATQARMAALYEELPVDRGPLLEYLRKAGVPAATVSRATPDAQEQWVLITMDSQARVNMQLCTGGWQARWSKTAPQPTYAERQAFLPWLDGTKPTRARRARKTTRKAA